MMSLGGYIVEYDFPYRDLIIVNETAEEIKFEIPVFDGSYIEEYEKLCGDYVSLEDIIYPNGRGDNY